MGVTLLPAPPSLRRNAPVPGGSNAPATINAFDPIASGHTYGISFATRAKRDVYQSRVTFKLTATALVPNSPAERLDVVRKVCHAFVNRSNVKDGHLSVGKIALQKFSATGVWKQEDVELTAHMLVVSISQMNYSMKTHRAQDKAIQLHLSGSTHPEFKDPQFHPHADDAALSFSDPMDAFCQILRRHKRVADQIMRLRWHEELLVSPLHYAHIYANEIPALTEHARQQAMDPRLRTPCIPPAQLPQVPHDSNPPPTIEQKLADARNPYLQGGYRPHVGPELGGSMQPRNAPVTGMLVGGATTAPPPSHEIQRRTWGWLEGVPLGVGPPADSEIDAEGETDEDEMGGVPL
ncbi:hypothetical protein P154DRAFT_533353 [Amniculicola lignicola CBS 123094]|uniref:Uncharacterized protein n=1 Tax=Amniculicola lignicola CBS 123094 TaxID=1392246 RepID=A0A6A5WJR8_9PLEO|nr:hypothetical protein P154DRAFT_533353 [Amniculicola lignicola CBS 123094]